MLRGNKPRYGLRTAAGAGLILFILADVTGCGGAGVATAGVAARSPPAGLRPGLPGCSSPNRISPRSAPRRAPAPTPRPASPIRTWPGSATDENNWLRSWTNDLYLWYSEVPDLDPANYTTAAYFPLLKTSGTDALGQPKDKFHFTYPTSTWEALSLHGPERGLRGAVHRRAAGTAAPDRGGVHRPGVSGGHRRPASLARGASVLSIDGVDAVNGGTQADVDILNAGLSPASTGESHTFSILDLNAASARTVTLTAVDVTDVPVQDVMVVPTTTTGYMLFTDQLATSEAALIAAVTTLKADAITDLVLDIRYNGGGYLDIASELAYMIAGPAPTAGQTFDLQQFNSKHPSTNPVLGTAITPTPFHTTTQGFSATAGQPLPTLNLARVFVLTTAATCSASEAVMNGLAGVGVQVIQIGSTTCGKPYGFYAQDNCGTTYFSIQFHGINAKGFGDYPDGFTPAATVGAGFPGCPVNDDFTHALGDPNESLLFVAQGYQSGQTCLTPPAGIGPAPGVRSGIAVRSPLREMRLMRHAPGAAH